MWTGLASELRRHDGLSGVFLGSLSIKVSFLTPSVITIGSVTVCFLISLLFPVNCSYLRPWSLPFVPPVSFSNRGGEGEVNMWHIVWCGFSRNIKFDNAIPKPWHTNTHQKCNQWHYYCHVSLCMFAESKYIRTSIYFSCTHKFLLSAQQKEVEIKILNF